MQKGVSQAEPQFVLKHLKKKKKQLNIFLDTNFLQINHRHKHKSSQQKLSDDICSNKRRD